MLNAHLHLAPRLRKSRVLHLYTLHTFMTSTGTVLPLPLPLRKVSSLEWRSCFYIFLPLTATDVTRRNEGLTWMFKHSFQQRDAFLLKEISVTAGSASGEHWNSTRASNNRFYSRTELIQEISCALMGGLSLGVRTSVCHKIPAVSRRHQTASDTLLNEARKTATILVHPGRKGNTASHLVAPQNCAVWS